MNTVAEKLPAAPATKGPRLHWPLLWTLVVTGVLIWGSHAHLERYITPQRGLGYWLGIIGGSMMVLLLSIRRASARRGCAGLAVFQVWFEIHMMLGLVGPTLVLFHAGFSLGATNSNVALICMLLVAGSGVIGRYIYTRLHAHLDGNEDTLEQLKAVGDRLRSQTTSITLAARSARSDRPGGKAADRASRKDVRLRRFRALVHGRPASRTERAGRCAAKSKEAVAKAAEQGLGADRAACDTASPGRSPLRGSAPGGRPPHRGISDVCAAVLVLARAAHPAVFHAVDRRHRARHCDQRVLIGHAPWTTAKLCAKSRVDDGDVLLWRHRVPLRYRWRHC
jgi:hypothetical protein